MWLHESESNSLITEAYENKIFLTIIYISNNSLSTSPGSNGVCRDGGGLVSEGGGGEVVQQVGEGGGQRAVVLGGHNLDTPIIINNTTTPR